MRVLDYGRSFGTLVSQGDLDSPRLRNNARLQV